MTTTLRSLACLSLCSLPLQAQTMFQLPAIDSVSVSTTGTYNDNRLRAYTGSGTNPLRVRGLFMFDVSSIPNTAVITKMKLTLYMENMFGSPFQGPVVDLAHTTDDTWTRASATMASGNPGVVVCAQQSGFVHPRHEFTINLAAYNFAPDLLDDRISLVIANTLTTYSYVYFFGHTGSPAGQNAVLEVTVGNCAGGVLAFGSAGKDSTGTSLRALSTGCPDRGQVLWLGASLGASLKPSIFVYLGASSTLWGATPLPLDLAVINAPGNWLNISPDLLAGSAPASGGSGTFPITIPTSAALAGQSFYSQSLIIDPPANGFGMVFSDAFKITIG